MKYIILIIVLFFTLSFLYSENFSWPQYRHDAQRTGRSGMNEGPQKNPYVAWQCDGNGFAVGMYDNIFITDAVTCCFDKNGILKWRNDDVKNAYCPMINKDGSKLWVCNTDYLFILNSEDGTILKRILDRDCDNYVEDKDGFVYGASLRDSLLFKFDEDGNELWSRELKGTLKGHSISLSGNIYVLTSTTITCYDCSGTEKWSREGNSINIQYYDYPVISPDETIYVIGCPQTKGLIAFNSDGTEKWAYYYKGKSLRLASDGIIFLKSEYYLSALTTDGNLKWRKSLEYAYTYDMAIDVNDYIYLRDNDDFVCFDKNGNELWRFTSDKNGNIFAIATDNTLYAYDYVNYIYAIKEKTGLPSSNSTSYFPAKSFSVSPNPFSNRLSISSSSSASIYSLTGQLVMNLPKGKHSVDTSSWREGVYIVKSGKECKRVVKIR